MRPSDATSRHFIWESSATAEAIVSKAIQCGFKSHLSYQNIYFVDSIDDITLLCPNCHSQTENWKGRNKKYGEVS